MKASGLTHTGKCRDNNQDCFSVNLENKIFIVADGMGGHYGGALASKTAVEEINKYLTKKQENINPEDFIKDAIIKANMEIFSFHKNMGTTLEIFTIIDKKGWIGHVGDSRIYMLRDNNLEQITEDHTRVMELINSGQLTKETAKNYPFQHVITRAVGIEEKVLPDIFSIDLKANDILIMCSDGLTGDFARYIVNEKDIIKAIKEEKNLDLACQRLVNKANEEGGPDNITILAVEIEEEDLMKND